MPNRGPRKSLIERDRAWLIDLCAKSVESGRLWELPSPPLSRVEQLMLHWRYGLNVALHRSPSTFKDIGVRYACSPERVRQIVNGALKKLREAESDD